MLKAHLQLNSRLSNPNQYRDKSLTRLRINSGGERKSGNQIQISIQILLYGEGHFLSLLGFVRSRVYFLHIVVAGGTTEPPSLCGDTAVYNWELWVRLLGSSSHFHHLEAAGRWVGRGGEEQHPRWQGSLS